MRKWTRGTIGVTAMFGAGVATLGFALSGVAGLGSDVRAATTNNAPSLSQIHNEYVRNDRPERELYLRGAWERAQKQAVQTRTERHEQLRREAAEAEAALSAAGQANLDEFGQDDGQDYGRQQYDVPQQTPVPTPSVDVPQSEL